MKVIKNIYYWIWNTFIHRTHLVKTKLPFGYWQDTDTRMLYACMNLLKDFVENEEGLDNLKKSLQWDSFLEHTDDINEEEYKKSAENSREILAIYNWWNAYLKKDEEVAKAYKKNSRFTTYYRNQLLFEQEILENQEDEMLERLMKVRTSLWT